MLTNYEAALNGGMVLPIFNGPSDGSVIFASVFFYRFIFGDLIFEKILYGYKLKEYIMYGIMLAEFLSILYW